jgi:hypothetical protein
MARSSTRIEGQIALVVRQITQVNWIIAQDVALDEVGLFVATIVTVDFVGRHILGVAEHDADWLSPAVPARTPISRGTYGWHCSSIC